MKHMHTYKWLNDMGMACSATTQFAIESHKHSNCGYNVSLLDNELTITCYSYATPVMDIVIDIDTRNTNIYSAYYDKWSKTTRKHIGYFLRYFHLNVDYQIVKSCAINDLIYTTYFNDTNMLLRLIIIAYHSTIS